MAERDASNTEPAGPEGFDITGRVESRTVRRSPGTIDFDETTAWQRDWEKRYRPLYSRLVGEILLEKQEQKAISYLNNLSINLHSHNLPFPVPLSTYIQNMNWGNTTDDPFSTCNMTLAMSLADATLLFTDEHGKMSPGQYIFISSKPGHIGKLTRTTESSQDLPFAEGMFLGYITDIQYGLNTDDQGNIIHTVSIQASSWIHCLQMGQYYISPVDIHDQNVPQAGTRGNPSPRPGPDTIDPELPGSSPFAMSMSDWTKILDIISAVAAGEEPTITDIEQFNPEDISSPIITTEFRETISKLGLRADLSGSMYMLIKMLSYPLLPASLKYEPFDINSWISLFYTHETNMDDLLILFRKSMSDEEFKRQAQWWAQFMRNVGYGATINSPSEYLNNLAEFLFEDITEAQEFEQAATTGTLNLAPTRLGDIIRVATAREDLPASCALRDTLPVAPLDVDNLGAIKSANTVSTTIWSLIEGTFDFDEEMYELYPVLVPIRQSDLEPNGTDWALLDYLHPLHRNMRCIPYIIYRQKPMFPGSKISNEYLDFHSTELNRDYFPQKFYRPLQYTTYSEQSGRNQESPNIMFANNPMHSNFVDAEDIISLSCQLTDLKRLNGVRIKNPFEAQQTQMSSNVGLADPIIDAYDAQRNGLRMYRGSYPLVGAKSDITTAVLGSYAERFFLTNGYENNMPSGMAELKYRHGNNLFPGTWAALNISGESYPTGWGDLRVFPDGTPVNPDAYNQMITRLRNMFIVYIRDVSHSISVDDIGNVSGATMISFERGTYGFQHPMLPYYKAATSDPTLYRPPSSESSSPIDLTPGANQTPPRELLQNLRATQGQSARTGATATGDGETYGQQNTADLRQIGGIDIFETERKAAQKETAARMFARGSISSSTYAAIIDDLTDRGGTFSYLEELSDIGLLPSTEIQEISTRLEYGTLITLMLQGGWITQAFHDTLQEAALNWTARDYNPIPRALRRAFRKEGWVQGNRPGGVIYGPGEHVDDGLEFNEAPLAPPGWDPNAFTELNPSYVQKLRPY